MKKILMTLICFTIVLTTPIVSNAETNAYSITTPSDATREPDICEISRYLSQILNTLQKKCREISSEYVSSPEQAMEIVLKYFDESKIEEYGINLSIIDYVPAIIGNLDNIYGVDGSFNLLIEYGEGSYKKHHVTIVSDTFKVPDDQINNVTWSNDPLVDDYFKRYFEALLNAKNDGVSMLKVNSIEQAYKYIKSLEPSGKDNSILVSIEIYEKREIPFTEYLFKKAISGTKENPNGEYGYFHPYITITSQKHNGRLAVMGRTIPILPVPYKISEEVSNQNFYSGNRDESYSEQIVIKPPCQSRNTAIINQSIMSGTWKKDSNGWKLRTQLGNYAVSRWANLNNKWYLFGDDGYMLTGWQKADGKWYLLTDDGEMLIGWHMRDNKWYYMGEDGSMLSNTITPDGYKVNENGEWVN